MISILVLPVASAVHSECFRVAYLEGMPKILQAVGKSRASAIAADIEEREISRITQLLTIEGVGKSTVKSLAKILGYRFSCLPKGRKRQEDEPKN